MPRIVELSETNNYYTVLLEKIQLVVSRLFGLVTTGCHQT